MKSESRLTNRIKKRLESEVGGLWVKVHGGPFQRGGLPDLIGCVQSRFIGLEVKLPGRENTITPRQLLALEAIEKAGGFASMVTTEEEAVIKVKTWLTVSIREEE